MTSKETRTKEWENKAIETIKEAIESGEKFVFSSEKASLANGSLAELVSLIICIAREFVNRGFPKDVLIKTMTEYLQDEEEYTVTCLGGRND